MELGTVRQIDIDQEMQTAYLDYAMSVIVARALPDVRDGLKPVQRRILYAMHDLGLRHDRPYKKSARIVGEVLGKYHPHGDAAVYEAMARMAQDFSLRYMLVDGQGNFGSIDGDNPAAMRYTEARLARIAEEMLADIDKDTVDFNPNFDGTLTEPSVLPAVLPNLLVNGASGIAVGMTTNIPPHNLGEVCDALAYLIDNYAKLDDITVEDLTRFIQGPDFPTGGVVYRFAGESDNGDRNDVILNAYALGRGQFTVQAQVHIEDMSRNRSRIVITELPYQVNKTRLIERIAELVRDGKLEGITDLRDESDRQGMRITIETTRTVEPRTILSQLFRQTPMQISFGLHLVALVDGEPRLLPLKKVLIHYLEHRQEVITRRSKFLLERARQRAHILEGLLKALDRIDEVIALIRRSRTTDTARANLQKALDLTEIQAQAILDMPLKRLAALEQKRIADELKEKRDEIAYLEGLLRSPAKIRGVIRSELMTLKENYGDARRTQIVDREKGFHTARDLVEAEDVVVTLWHGGEVSRSLRPPAITRTMPIAQSAGSTRDDVAFFAASGLAALAPLHQVPDDRAMPVSGLTPLDRSEALVGALILPQAQVEEDGSSGFLTLATRGGRIKRVTVEDFKAAASRGAVTAINVEQGDQLGWVALTRGQGEIVLVTRQGKAIRFAEEEVRPMGLSAAGVLAIRLAEDDAVVGMGLVRDKGFVVTVTEQGFAKRTPVADFAAQKRYGGGIQAAKLSGRTGPVAVAILAAEGDELALLTSRGEVATCPVKAVPAGARAHAGQRARADTKQPLVDPAKHGAPIALAVVGAGFGTAGPAGANGASAPPGKPARAAKAGADGKVKAESPAGPEAKPAGKSPRGTQGGAKKEAKPAPAASKAGKPGTKTAEKPAAAKTTTKATARRAPAKSATPKPAAKGAAGKPPAKGATTEAPTKSPAGKRPAKGAAAEEPATGSRSKRPAKGAEPEAPATSAGTRPPAQGLPTKKTGSGSRKGQATAPDSESSRRRGGPALDSDRGAAPTKTDNKRPSTGSQRSKRQP